MMSLLAAGLALFTLQDPAPPPDPEALARQLLPHVTAMAPDRTASPAADRLVVRRLDVVDDAGVVRLSLDGSSEEVVIDGVAYRRGRPVAGLLVFDEAGSERGGLGYNPAHGRTQMVFDYEASEAVAVAATEAGGVEILLRDRPEPVRPGAFGGRQVPGVPGQDRIRIRLAPDGAPEILLADAAERPRLRLALTPDGSAVIEFLDAEGRTVRSIGAQETAGE